MQQSPTTGAAHLRSREVEALTEKIMACYRKTTSELIEVGRCISEIKKLLDYKEFVVHIEGRLGMSTTQAARLMALFERFGKNPNHAVLNAKPTVLYILAESNSEEIESLIRGREANVDGKRKSVKELSVKDAKKIAGKKQVELNFEFDRELATLCEEAIDEFSFFIAEAQNKVKVLNKANLRAYVQEVRSCLAQLENILR